MVVRLVPTATSRYTVPGTDVSVPGTDHGCTAVSDHDTVERTPYGAHTVTARRPRGRTTRVPSYWVTRNNSVSQNYCGPES
eukprot:SAG11_NODE_560_length_8528_cov_4.697710_14_plen_81_part_00